MYVSPGAGWETTGGGTIPPALCVTNMKPDIVIIDSHKQGSEKATSVTSWM